MLGWGVEDEGVSMKCCIIWRSSSWRNDWSPNRVIHIWINMFVCLYAGRCKLQVSVWPRNLTFGLILITHCHWDMRKCFVLYSNTRVVKHIPAEYTVSQGLWNFYIFVKKFIPVNSAYFVWHHSYLVVFACITLSGFSKICMASLLFSHHSY